MHQQVFKDLLLSCVLLQTAIKSTELHSRAWKMLQGFPHMGKVHRSHISWGTKCVCVHVDTCVLTTRAGSGAQLPTCDLFSPFLKFSHLLRWMLDAVT